MALPSSSSSSADYSGRPLDESSVPVSSSSTSSTTEVKNQQPINHLYDDKDGPFVPDLFDIVHFASQRHHVASAIKDMPVIPDLYTRSEAVDSSTELGSGASFHAYRRRVPEHIPTTLTTDMGGWTVSRQENKQKRPGSVVYKTARVAFDERGEATPETETAAKTILKEFLILSHRPLMENANIITLLGVAWGSNSSTPSLRLPALVLEHAQHRSLADLQGLRRLSDDLCIKICIDVAQGLQALHRHGIVHGDVKSENVLICADKEHTYIAKLGDFGFSVLGSPEHKPLRIGGTRPWQAPEAGTPIQPGALASTDVYSFGLLVWRVMTRIANPFSLFIDIDAKASSQQFYTAAEVLKQSADFRTQLHAHSWYSKLNFAPALKKLFSNEKDNNTNWLSAFISPQNMTNPTFVSKLREEVSGGGALFQAAAEKIVSQLPWTAKYNATIEACIQLNPTSRDLNAALTALRGSDPSVQIEHNIEHDINLRKNYRRHTLSWENINQLEPDLQGILGRALQAQDNIDIASERIHPPKCFILAALAINGHGIPRNFDLATNLLLRAANAGHQPAQAYSYRILKAIGTQGNHKFNQALGRQASLGCRLALQDLAELEPETATKFRAMNQELKAGIGSDFFSAKNMLHGNLMTAWLHMMDKDVEGLVTKARAVKDLSKFKINSRGDSILHFAAATGRNVALQTLLREFPVLDVNQLNEEGETLLLCACRSGHYSTTKLLLSLGADVSRATQSKETPLHWLVSFAQSEVIEIGDLLFSAGADQTILTTKSIAYSAFPSGIDVDHKAPGSPLLWAVHENRVDIVNYLMSREGSENMADLAVEAHLSPVGRAAWFHHKDCLEAIVKVCDERKRNITYSSLMGNAIGGANRFSMILRNGANWKTALTETIVYIAELAKRAAYGQGMDGRGMTALHLAIEDQKPDAVEVLLERGLEINRQFEEARSKDPEANAYTHAVGTTSRPGIIRPEHLDTAHNATGFTPILAAVASDQLQVVELLQKHGANVNDVAINPFTRDKKCWNALHIIAQARLETDLGLARFLISQGVPVEGGSKLEPEDPHSPYETPFMVACLNNVFKLADLLLENGANVNAKARGCAFQELSRPTTVLGHIVASAARHSALRIRYLLSQCLHKDRVSFVVEPETQTTALHRAAQGFSDLFQRGPEVVERAFTPWIEYDWAANREIIYELLQRWNMPEFIDAVDQQHGMTALMFASAVCNVGAVELLLQAGAKTDVKNKSGMTAYDIATSTKSQKLHPTIAKANAQILQLLDQQTFIETQTSIEALALD